MNKKMILSLIFIVLFAIIFLIGYYIYLTTNENENENLKNQTNTLSNSNSANTIPEDTNNSTLNQTYENTLNNNEINFENSTFENTTNENSVFENTINENSTSENTIVDLPTTSSYNGYCLRSGYLNSQNSDKFIIKNPSELQDFCNKYNKYTYDSYGNKKSGTLDNLLSKYNDHYFNNQSLAIKYIELSSGGDTVNFIKATKINKSVLIDYEVDTSRGFTEDMSGYLVIVEVDKDITEIS